MKHVIQLDKIIRAPVIRHFCNNFIGKQLQIYKPLTTQMLEFFEKNFSFWDLTTAPVL